MQGSADGKTVYEADVLRAATCPPERVHKEPELVQRSDICAVSASWPYSNQSLQVELG